MKTTVFQFLRQAGYNGTQIAHGFDYADEIGWEDADTLGQLALSRILYSDQQLESGELVGWEPMWQ